MSAGLPPRRPRRWSRQHGTALDHDRIELEEAGWRTTLEYRENHIRGRDGHLEQLRAVWSAEAERLDADGVVQVISASASTRARAWSELRTDAELADLRSRRRAAEQPVARL